MADLSTEASGWLSTRNKRKISAGSVSKSKRRKSLVSRRPVGFGYTFTQNSPPPPELLTHTRQTSINRFFRAKNGIEISTESSNDTVQFDEHIGDLNFTCMFEDNSESVDQRENTPPHVENSEKGNNPHTSFVKKCLNLTDCGSDKRVALSEMNRVDFDTNQTELKSGSQIAHVAEDLPDAKETINFNQRSTFQPPFENLKTRDSLLNNTTSGVEPELNSLPEVGCVRKEESTCDLHFKTNDILKINTSPAVESEFNSLPEVGCVSTKESTCHSPRQSDTNVSSSPNPFCESLEGGLKTEENVENTLSEFNSELEENSESIFNDSKKLSKLSGLPDDTLEDFSDQLPQNFSGYTLDSLSLEMSLQSSKKTSVDNFSEPFTFAFLSQDPTLRTRGITSVGLLGAVKGDNYEYHIDDTVSLTDIDTELNLSDSQISDIDLALDSHSSFR